MFNVIHFVNTTASNKGVFCTHISMFASCLCMFHGLRLSNKILLLRVPNALSFKVFRRQRDGQLCRNTQQQNSLLSSTQSMINAPQHHETCLPTSFPLKMIANKHIGQKKDLFNSSAHQDSKHESIAS